MNVFLVVEYEKLIKDKEKQEEKQKAEQLEKLQHDLGEGQTVPLATNVASAQAFKPQVPSNITLGVGLDSDDEDDEAMEDENRNEDEQKEAESFKRFLEREKQKKGT